MLLSVVPLDLYSALATIPKEKLRWRSLDSTARRDLIDWINEATTPISRKRRLEKACVDLAAGKTGR